MCDIHNVVLWQSVLHWLVQARLRFTGLLLRGADATSPASIVNGRECIGHGTVPLAKLFACSAWVCPNAFLADLLDFYPSLVDA